MPSGDDVCDPQLVKQPQKWTARQWSFLLAGTMTITTTNGCFAFFAPFFPPVAIGPTFPTLHEIDVALIFSAFSVVQLFVSPLSGAVASRFGRQNCIKYGVASLCVATLAFGLLPRGVGAGAPGWLLTSLFCLLRGAQGAGVAISSTALLAAIADSFSEEAGRGQAISAGELAGSWGWTIAPAAGAVLYDAGGFITPFAVMAALPAALLPLLLRVMPLDQVAVNEAKAKTRTAAEHEKGSAATPGGGGAPQSKESVHVSFPGTDGADVDDEVSVSDPVFSMATVQRFLKLASWSRCLVLISIGCTFTCWSAFDLGFTQWLTAERGYSLAAGGRFFAVAPLCYGAMALPAGWVVDRVEAKKRVIIAGWVSQVLAFGSFRPLMPLLDGPALTAALVLVMAVCGLGAPLLIVPALPDMLQGIEDEGDAGDAPDGEAMTDFKACADELGLAEEVRREDEEGAGGLGIVMAGASTRDADFSCQRNQKVEAERNTNCVTSAFNTMMALGSVMGPLLGAPLIEHFGFTATISAAGAFEFLVLVLLTLHEVLAHRSMRVARGGYSTLHVVED